MWFIKVIGFKWTPIIVFHAVTFTSTNFFSLSDAKIYVLAYLKILFSTLGPCLLFERYASNGSKTGRRFYACSACRDRKECSFFQWADDDMPKERQRRWQEIILEKKPPYTHEEYMRYKIEKWVKYCFYIEIQCVF